jgi:hypothetical protein
MGEGGQFSTEMKLMSTTVAFVEYRTIATAVCWLLTMIYNLNLTPNNLSCSLQIHLTTTRQQQDCIEYHQPSPTTPPHHTKMAPRPSNTPHSPLDKPTGRPLSSPRPTKQSLITDYSRTMTPTNPPPAPPHPPRNPRASPTPANPLERATSNSSVASRPTPPCPRTNPPSQSRPSSHCRVRSGR